MALNVAEKLLSQGCALILHLYSRHTQIDKHKHTVLKLYLGSNSLRKISFNRLKCEIA